MGRANDFTIALRHVVGVARSKKGVLQRAARLQVLYEGCLRQRLKQSKIVECCTDGVVFVIQHAAYRTKRDIVGAQPNCGEKRSATSRMVKQWRLSVL